MKILMIGDIVGGPGRMAMARIATRYKAEKRADVVIANAENSAAGRGITSALAEELFAGGADALTMGDHVWDQKEAVAYYDRETRVVRALNLDATDFINKPIGRSALDAALKRAEARLNDNRRDTAPLSVEISSGVGILSIHGTLSGLHKDQFTASLQRALDSGAKGIVISFDNFSAVNGTGIALLTRLLSETRATGTPVYIAGLSENFKTIFDMVGITRVAPCVDTVETAMSAMGENKSM